MTRRLIVLTILAASALTLGGCGKAKEAAEGAGAVKDLTSALGDITSSLGEIKDEASATAALPKLESAGTALEGLTSKLDSLPAPIKEQIKTQAAGFTEKLDPIIEKLKAIPGVGGIIEGPIETLKGHLTTLSS